MAAGRPSPARPVERDGHAQFTDPDPPPTHASRSTRTNRWRVLGRVSDAPRVEEPDARTAIAWRGAGAELARTACSAADQRAAGVGNRLAVDNRGRSVARTRVKTPGQSSFGRTYSQVKGVSKLPGLGQGALLEGRVGNADGHDVLGPRRTALGPLQPVP